MSLEPAPLGFAITRKPAIRGIAPDFNPMNQGLTPNCRFSQPAAENAALHKALEGRGDILNAIPSIPAVLQTLISELNQPADQVNLARVAELVGRDEALAAQCLRMANSPLFGLATPADSLRGAVRTLGIAHLRDIAVSASMMRVASTLKDVDPIVFWEHSLGCAILSRKLARIVGFRDPEKAYLAGLLHDLGYIVNFVLSPQQANAALNKGAQEGIFLGEVEYQEMGFTHCQSGELVARKWKFADEIVEVILCHHNPAAAVIDPALVAIVALADRTCRSSSLGLYKEQPAPPEAWQADWNLLASKCPMAGHVSWADFVKDSDVFFAEIHELVKAMYH
jgi:putative nucleotidyltransferase with HDIG domain